MPLYMLPVPISESGTFAIPAYAREVMLRTPIYVMERGKTGRQLLKASAPEIDLPAKTFIEMGEAPYTDALKQVCAHLQAGQDVAVVSESGCPGVADPGAVFAEGAHQLGIRVVPIVGPSSILLALMASGFNGQQFAFLGYLTQKKEDLEKALAQLEDRSRKGNQTQIFIETPYRNMQMLEALVRHLNPDTRLCLAYDLTGQRELIISQRVHVWRKKPLPKLEKLPAIFLVLCG